MSAQPAATDDSKARELGKGLFEQMGRQFPDMNDVLWLVNNGASMGVTDKDGLTPLLRAMSWGNRGVIRAMLGHGADVNYSGGRTGVTALQIAAAGSDGELVRLMLGRDGDVLKKNNAGLSALDIACRHQVPDVLAPIEARAEAQEAAAQVERAAREAVEKHRQAVNAGMPVERPFPPLKPLRLKPR